MTRIDFYHDAADKFGAAARVVHKAVAQGHRVVVNCADEDQLGQFDRLLWMNPPTGFVPHVRAGNPLAPQTPVVLSSPRDAVVADDVLINLDRQVPGEFSRCQRLIEIIGRDEADKAPGRERFKQYRDQGFEIGRHDLAGRQAHD